MRGHVWPNPPVGCVIVKDGLAVAEAATQPGGRPHAERKGLDQAGASATGATLYVTLEPCCDWTRTPPCVDAIIGAGVSRVVCAIRDPDPRVNGGGFAKLREARLDVMVGLCEGEAARLVSVFFHRVRHGQPELVVMGHTLSEVPAGVDAMIISSQRGPRLLSRPGEIDVAGVEQHRLLRRMGEFGLTSAAVSGSDPLLSALSSSKHAAVLVG